MGRKGKPGPTKGPVAWVKMHRKLLGVRQIELAKQTGIQQARLSRFENGLVDLSLDELKKIAQAFGPRVLERSEAGTLDLPKVESAGKRVKELRRMNGITQEELADATGIHQQSISLYENDYLKLTAGQIGRIADFLTKRSNLALPVNNVFRDYSIKASLGDVWDEAGVPRPKELSLSDAFGDRPQVSTEVLQARIQKLEAESKLIKLEAESKRLKAESERLRDDALRIHEHLVWASLIHLIDNNPQVNARGVEDLIREVKTVEMSEVVIENPAYLTLMEAVTDRAKLVLAERDSKSKQEEK